MFGVTGDADVYCDLDAMNAVNPNLAMTNSVLENGRDDNSREVCCEDRKPTDDVEPEILYTWDENDIIYESEPIVSQDHGLTVSSQLEHVVAAGTQSPTALVVTCKTKQVRQQQTIIVTRTCHPVSYSTSPIVARVSKAAGVLSKMNPTAVTVDASSGLIVKKNAVILSAEENCLC